MLNPRVDFRIYEFILENKKIVIFEIPPAINQPTKFNNIAYIRVGSATPKLSDYPEKERKIWNNINRKSFEKGIAKENVSVSEVLSLLDYAKYFSLTKQELPSETQQFTEKMYQHGLVKKVFDNCYDITNLGAILFAKNLKDFPTIKRKSVRVVLYKGNTRENRLKEQEGLFGYAISFESLLDYVNDKLPFNEVISKSLRKEAKMYPEVAIREFVANALIHQDLSISGAGPMIEIFDNRIEITNTGEPLIDTDRFIDNPPRSRNEDMASFMRQIGVCEEGGTGIDRALINIALYQLPAPNFEKYDNFTKVTLYAYKRLKDMTLDDKTRACFQHCVLKYVENSRMTNTTLRERLGIGEKNYPTASAIIKATIGKKLIKESEKPKEYVPFWA
jgi:predicted HTH transcriptional regulator